MDTDVRTVLDKVPLAEATWLLFNQVLPDDTLDAIVDRHRGACYQREFTFANLVHLVNDALCRHGGRAKQTLQRHAHSGECPASEQAFYGKLRQLPIPLSEALLIDATKLLRPWLARQPRVALPASLRALRVLAIDGKTLQHAAKRLKPVRGHAGRGLGGKALVALELSTGLLVGMTADPDGHANEAKLVPQLPAGSPTRYRPSAKCGSSAERVRRAARKSRTNRQANRITRRHRPSSNTS
ncbi:MAG TPA: hypothetical protein VHR66_09250 [Gemmataceae bacterium]|jgi:hypothetical protein|nr:hypothetical protein [Gemmataceae bacterium]